MESENTKQSKQSITRHLVTFTVYRKSYAPTETFTEVIQGDLAEWFEKMHQDPSITKVVVNQATYLW